ncbi:MAG: triose-phosphate isomerase [Candidatus Dormibacteria bacterium]
MVAGNWKMNTSVAAGVALARAVAEGLRDGDAVDVAVIPPFTHLVPVGEALRGTRVRLGAQDVFWEDAGAFTGEVSAPMLADLCDLVVVGHSERRHLLGETDAQTGLKLRAALRHGLQVIVAVGETAAERDAGGTHSVVDRQLEAALAPLETAPDAARWLVAYEPVWAIGTGRTATVEQAEEVCAHIRARLAERTGGQPPRILYGGSVNAGNAASLFAAPSIDGGLIGGASLDPDAFAAIVAAAAGS